MDVRLSGKLYDTLVSTPELPEHIAAGLATAAEEGDGRIIVVDEEARMTLEEMCQWHIMKDPDTGELTEKAMLYDEIINAIYDADLG